LISSAVASIGLSSVPTDTVMLSYIHAASLPSTFLFDVFRYTCVAVCVHSELFQKYLKQDFGFT